MSAKKKSSRPGQSRIQIHACAAATAFRHPGRRTGSCGQPGDAACGRIQARGFPEAADRHRQHLEHGHAVQHAHRPAGAGIGQGGGCGRRQGIIFNTITISDGISMGTEGMKYSLVSREVIADSIETVVGCENLDGFVAIGGCDKNMPGCVMAMARLNRPSVFVYGGTILPGCHDGKDADIVTVFEAVGQARGGRHRRCRAAADRGGVDSRARGRAAACTPRTRWPARSRRWGFRCRTVRPRRRSATTSCATVSTPGAAVLHLIQRGIRPRDILCRESFLNSIALIIGAGRLDQCGAAPGGDGAQRRGEAGHRRLHQRRPQDAGAGRPQAVRALRDVGAGQDRRHAAADEDAARGEADRRRRDDGDRQDAAGKPGQGEAVSGGPGRDPVVRQPDQKGQAISSSCAAIWRRRGRWRRSAARRD